MNHKNHVLRVALLGAIAGSLSGAGHAQDSAAATAYDRRATTLDEVMVTARRVEESLQDTPVSVSAFSRNDIEMLGVSEAGDIARYTPNLEMRKQSGSDDNFAIALRGLYSAEPSLAVEPTVGVYVDGVYLARVAGMAFDIVDMERIEVLRGPQGTLFGRNTIGGAINVVTQKPRGEFALRQQVTQHNRGSRLQTTIDTPRLGDFSAKLSYLRTNRNGEYKSLHTGAEVGSAQADAARLALRWEPTDTFSADYSFDWSRRDSSAQNNQLTHVRDLHANPASPYYGGAFFDTLAQLASRGRQSALPVLSTASNESYSDIDSHALTLEWDASPALTIKSITSYREWDRRGNPDWGYAPAPADGSLCPQASYNFLTGSCAQPVAAGELVPIFQARGRSGQRQFTQEFQFIGSLFDDQLRYTTGFYYFEEKGREASNQTLVVPAALSVAGTPLEAINQGNSIVVQQPFLNYRTDNQSWAIYGDFTYTVTPRLDLTLGLRYTVDRKETTLTNNLRDTPQSPAASATLQTVKDDEDWSNFNPSLTLNFAWTDDITVYGKVATGYRSGGYNIRANNVESFRQPFDEEHLVSYEFGWKTDLLDRSLRFNGAAFHMVYDDRQVAQFDAGSGGASTNIVNAGKSTVTGFEVEAIWLPTAGLRLMASYGYQDTDFKKFITSAQDPVTGLPLGQNVDISNLAKGSAPRQSASGIVEYAFEPMHWGALTLRLDATYTDEMAFHPQLNRYDSAPSFTLINARASLAEIPLGEYGHLELALWGRNITNRKYREFGIDFGQLGFASNAFGPLATYGLDIVYTFNR